MKTHTITAKCSVCRTRGKLEVSAEEYKVYMSGVLVQKVWPDATPDERELIIASRTGFWTCPPCWDVFYALPPEDMDEAEWKR